jgi:hypothetical protein
LRQEVPDLAAQGFVFGRDGGEFQRVYHGALRRGLGAVARRGSPLSVSTLKAVQYYFFDFRYEIGIARPRKAIPISYRTRKI